MCLFFRSLATAGGLFAQLFEQDGPQGGFLRSKLRVQGSIVSARYLAVPEPVVYDGSGSESVRYQPVHVFSTAIG